MINLIDYTYFRDELQIANTATADVQTFLNVTIARKQYEFLQLLLGPALYEQFVTWYGIDPSDQTNRFYYLLNGMTFVSEGRTVRWVGLRDATLKISPIANYVYYRYQENNTTQTTSPGETKTNSQNASGANAVAKMVTAWNANVNYLEGYRAFMKEFYSSECLVQSAVLLPYHAPVQIQAGVTVGVVAGATSFTFDGTNGTADWRGYDIFPERIGTGTMVRGTQYSWNITTGRFDLLQDGDSFQPNEYFNITFGLNGVGFVSATTSLCWDDWYCKSEKEGIYDYINFLGL